MNIAPWPQMWHPLGLCHQIFTQMLISIPTRRRGRESMAPLMSSLWPEAWLKGLLLQMVFNCLTFAEESISPHWAFRTHRSSAPLERKSRMSSGTARDEAVHRQWEMKDSLLTSVWMDQGHWFSPLVLPPCHLIVHKSSMRSVEAVGEKYTHIVYIVSSGSF